MASRAAAGELGLGILYNLGYERKIVPAEASRILPSIAIFVDASDRNIVTHPLFRFVFPDRSFDATHSNFVDRASGCVGSCHNRNTFQKKLSHKQNKLTRLHRQLALKFAKNRERISDFLR